MGSTLEETVERDPGCTSVSRNSRFSTYKLVAGDYAGGFMVSLNKILEMGSDL